MPSSIPNRSDEARYWVLAEFVMKFPFVILKQYEGLPWPWNEGTKVTVLYRHPINNEVIGNLRLLCSSPLFSCNGYRVRVWVPAFRWENPLMVNPVVKVPWEQPPEHLPIFIAAGSYSWIRYSYGESKITIGFNEIFPARDFYPPSKSM